MRTTDERLRELAPITDEQVRDLALDGEVELVRAIAGSSRRNRRAALIGRGAGRGVAGPGRHGRLPLAAVVASAALVALIGAAGVVVLAGSGDGSPGRPAVAPGATVEGTTAPSDELERTLRLLPPRLADVRPTTPARPLAGSPDMPGGPGTPGSATGGTIDATGSGADTSAGSADSSGGTPEPPAGSAAENAPAGAATGRLGDPTRYALPGWQVVRVDESGRDGEMTFRLRGSAFDLHWRGSGSLSRWVDDRADDARRLPAVEVAGHRAALFAYHGARGRYTALWRDGDYTLEFSTGAIARGGAPLSAERFAQLVRGLRVVPTRAWTRMLPPTTVLPGDGERIAVARAMVADVALPPGFDVERVAGRGGVRDRYQLGAQVLGAAACGWLERWVAARRAGDDAARRAAVAALAGSRGWAALHEMDAEGGYPEVLWEYADAVAGSGQVPGGRPRMSVARTYRAALGCGAG